MSTPCIIGQKNDNGSIDLISCHWDGYPDYAGDILFAYYRGNPGKIDELLSLGDLSSIGPDIRPAAGRMHSVRNPVRGVCLFYGRDAGETVRKARHVSNFEKLQEYAEKQEFADYAYILDRDSLEGYKLSYSDDGKVSFLKLDNWKA